MSKSENILIIDLEATCSSDDSISPELMEIIEVGAVWVSAEGAVVDKFQKYVRPSINHQLTSFCMDLTGIKQVQIDQALGWPEVAEELSQFIDQHRTSQSYWGSWGVYDRNQIERESCNYRVKNPVREIRHENLKANFAKNRRIKQVGMVRALQIIGLPMVGDHHRAISDALNIARMLPECLRST